MTKRMPAGTYVFDVASPTALDVLVVRSGGRGKVFYIGFTRTISRPRHMSAQTPVAFGEAVRRTPPLLIHFLTTPSSRIPSP
jgi:hypothetical protein